MKRIAFLTDIHANLPALEQTIAKIEKLDCDKIIIGGDVIGIGPFPSECIDLLRNRPNIQMVNGNHEIMAVLPRSELGKVCTSPGEIEHTLWYRSQLNTEQFRYIKSNPLEIRLNIEDSNIVFVHYPLKDTHTDYPFEPIEKEISGLKKKFQHYSADLICFGHDHKPTSLDDHPALYNPGSLGCSKHAIARFAVLEFNSGTFHIFPHQVKYDDKSLVRAFNRRQVPEREFIVKNFFGNRFAI